MEEIRQALAVVLVMGLLAAATWWLRRKGLARVGPSRPGRRLEVAERLALGPQHALCLVRAGERGFLVGLSPAGCQVLESGEWSRFGTTGHAQ